jgi:uncharacterized protein
MAACLLLSTVVDHIHHSLALTWFVNEQPDLATCPITQGTLLRFLLREGKTVVEAVGLLDVIRSQQWHVFWPDVLPFVADQLAGVIDHRQVTDAYLVALTRHNKGRLVTLDKGLATLHQQHVHLLV